MELVNKVILIISSEKWGKIFISKHHYAVTLAQSGNTVYFLNPVDFTLPKGAIRIENTEVNENLYLITYRPFFPWILKFHVKWAFEVLIQIQIKIILKKIKQKIDIVWDFNCSYLYNDLSFFKAGLNIFHPVDKLSPDSQNKKADVVFSVSPLVLDDHKVSKVPKFLINHGLSKDFESIASEQPAVFRDKKLRIQVCYIGNLLIASLNRDILTTIISAHPEVDFIFIGPYNNVQNNFFSGLNSDDESFISFLDNAANVTLKGTLSGKEMAREITQYDAFIICYKCSQHYRCDNSHKVLEYLSAGKVIISTPLLYYKDSDILQMSKTETEYPDLFSAIINDLDFYNSIALIRKRKEYAKNNTYEKQIRRIEGIINELYTPVPDK